MTFEQYSACGQMIGHGERCSSRWLCSDCKEKSQIAEQERAAIVAWLLEIKELYLSRGQDTYVALEDIAHNIERGEHHGAPPE